MKTKKQKIDLGDTSRRFEAIQKSFEFEADISSEEKKKILNARAKEQAKEPDAAEAGKTIEVVEFLLADENYGIESACIREVYPLTDLTPLPCTPAFVLGIINVRGQILSVIDMKKFFELPEKGITELNKVIILSSDHMIFGVLADAVLGTKSIPITEIQPPLPTLTDIRAEYLKGVTNKPLIILDARKILMDEKIVVIMEA